MSHSSISLRVLELLQNWDILKGTTTSWSHHTSKFRRKPSSTDRLRAKFTCQFHAFKIEIFAFSVRDPGELRLPGPYDLPEENRWIVFHFYKTCCSNKGEVLSNEGNWREWVARVSDPCGWPMRRAFFRRPKLWMGILILPTVSWVLSRQMFSVYALLHQRIRTQSKRVQSCVNTHFILPKTFPTRPIFISRRL